MVSGKGVYSMEGAVLLSEAPLGTGIVVVESVYSMDGSMAPLSAVCDVVDEFKGNLIVDEAHTLGLYGDTGVGLVDSLNLRHRVFATVHPFGKALGFHGAVIVGSNLLMEYLHNYSRSFIYTTALPNTSLVAIRLLWDEMITAKPQRQKVADLINLFGAEAHAAAQRTPNFDYIPSNSPIQALVVGSNHKAISAAAYLKRRGIMTFPIRSPTVAKGTERLRVVLHAHNTEEEVKALISAYEAFLIESAT
ncbi:hypothetical protein SARC_06030 [Sphaeroforma arctica JP610]|uniref:Aminotransferase class I/classII large domain-containing protein n=1 Tax=Sphaeroforma arctica JP610 TaxID=667725 RepID=A0A0L0FYG4_9EUKA|nr:hypothetical protein SARC_06030 [Sphaeroforma arctica JP610]KNC81659.1 hypothetical protein SARC_06030 [Sphaeroforma arctica JP610]|eukprot:XP_014155561.1 hypothetical protein SARC_06030 [Sphaeroforma arctica JP610]